MITPELIAQLRAALNILGNWHIGPPGGRTGFGKHLRYIYADGISIRVSGDDADRVAMCLQDLRNHAPALLDEIERLLARVEELEAAPNTCRWREDEHGYYHTACGHLWQFTEGGIKGNSAAYCQYCGGKIVEEAE